MKILSTFTTKNNTCCCFILNLIALPYTGNNINKTSFNSLNKITLVYLLILQQRSQLSLLAKSKYFFIQLFLQSFWSILGAVLREKFYLQDQYIRCDQNQNSNLVSSQYLYHNRDLAKEVACKARAQARRMGRVN